MMKWRTLAVCSGLSVVPVCLGHCINSGNAVDDRDPASPIIYSTTIVPRVLGIIQSHAGFLSTTVGSRGLSGSHWVTLMRAHFVSATVLVCVGVRVYVCVCVCVCARAFVSVCRRSCKSQRFYRPSRGQ